MNGERSMLQNCNWNIKAVSENNFKVSVYIKELSILKEQKPSISIERAHKYILHSHRYTYIFRNDHSFNQLIVSSNWIAMLTLSFRLAKWTPVLFNNRKIHLANRNRHKFYWINVNIYRTPVFTGLFLRLSRFVCSLKRIFQQHKRTPIFCRMKKKNQNAKKFLKQAHQWMCKHCTEAHRKCKLKRVLQNHARNL